MMNEELEAQEREPTRANGGRSQKRASNGLIPLYRRSSGHFQASERDRGAELFAAGAVTAEIDEERACGSVIEPGGNGDPATLKVGIDWTRVAKRRVHVFCECKRFAGGKLCRHIWATLLALGESGPENQPPGKDRLGLRRDRAVNWSDLGIARPKQSVHHAGPPRQQPAAAVGRRNRVGVTSWRSQLASLRDEIGTQKRPLAAAAVPHPRATSTVHFFINIAASLNASGLVLDVFELGGGKSAKMKRSGVSLERLQELLFTPRSANGNSDASTTTLALVTEISGAASRKGKGARSKTKASGIKRFRLPQQLYDNVLPYLCAQGTLGWWDGRTQSRLHPLWWDAGTAWHLTLRLKFNRARIGRISGLLEREGEQLPLDDAMLVLASEDGPAFAVFAESIGRLELDRRRDLPWITLLRNSGDMVFPKKDVEQALTELLELPALPRFEIPEELELEEEESPPQPRLTLEPSPASAQLSPPLVAEISYDYGPLRVSAEDSRSSLVDWEEHTLLRRDLEAEYAALVRLLELGLQPVGSTAEGNVQALELKPSELPTVIEPLLQEGWAVEVQGRSVRSPNPPSLRVESGIDWFDLSGEVDFAGDRKGLKTVLDAVSRGDRFIELEDGSQGLLPASWMETYVSLSELASDDTAEGLRFLPSQALLVDSLLSAMPPADVDAAFVKLREKLASFERIKPKKESRAFEGTLRSYQRQGLGWLAFLREFGLGGVLADDMGLGKTVQVLALIQTYRTPSKTTNLPFLVVAPRSVVYNWLDEAAHFTPKLRAVEYRGADREQLRDRLNEFDIVVTTYGTLRRDISFLASVEFDSVILDEAQAIKNSTSQTAKASRLLTAQHRLALTGTPIENHLGELGSIFEFLNPGLLGRLPRLEILNGARTPSKQELEQLANDLRPFILRRTKEQVLPDLPAKTEQTLLCNLHPEQREIYDQLRAKYHDTLLEQVETQGVSGSAIQVLEALLRLRQVACHPGLVDSAWEEAGSAKLETLFEQVEEVLDEGHKLLVFSQFTKLLAYVRRHLDAEGVRYAYLDGQTRDRAGAVEEFQNDPDCNLFLISLKAGGTGLNLTAAGYVFLLDPWWNPAVEAQAIDRTHRIGQTQPVFAYRMIARDTVEEKILQLQSSKRKLAGAVLEGDGKALRDLTADDLRLLLS